MPLDGHADVVVVGFGMSGVASALVAARAGARVLLLDQGVPTRRRLVRSRAARSREALRAGLWEAARAAGVEVRPQCRVHELIVDGGKVCGVGYAMLPSEGIVPRGHRLLRGMSERMPARVSPLLDRPADALWRSAFGVGEIGCFRVVLALSPRHWEFVGPAMWAASRGLDAAPPPPPAPVPPKGSLRGLRAVAAADGDGRPTPELAVRNWCISREAAGSAALAASEPDEEELRIDEMTGAVLIREGRRVRGLYAAAHADDDRLADFWAGAVPAAAELGGGGAGVRRAS